MFQCAAPNRVHVHQQSRRISDQSVYKEPRRGNDCTFSFLCSILHHPKTNRDSGKKTKCLGRKRRKDATHLLCPRLVFCFEVRLEVTPVRTEANDAFSPRESKRDLRRKMLLCSVDHIKLFKKKQKQQTQRHSNGEPPGQQKSEGRRPIYDWRTKMILAINQFSSV